MSTNLVPGTFKVRALEGTLGLANTGTEQVGVMLEVLDADYAGETITWYGYFTEKTQDRTIESLRLLGWEGDDLFDLSTLGGAEAFAVVQEEEDNQGQLRLKVQWINGKGGVAMKTPMTDEQRRAFSARMKGNVIAHRQKTQGAGTQSRQPSQQRSQQRPQSNGGARYDQSAPAPSDGDDIPF